MLQGKTLLLISVLIIFIFEQNLSKELLGDLQENKDDKILRLEYLNKVDKEIAKLISKHSQLKHWDCEVEDIKSLRQGQSDGKYKTDFEIYYGNKLLPTPSSNYKDWFGKKGCQIHLRLVKKELELAIQPEASIKSRRLGYLGKYIIVGTVITEHPENKTLENEVWCAFLGGSDGPCGKNKKTDKNSLLKLNN